MSATDQMLARYMGEIEERRSLLENLSEQAAKEDRDLTAQELELATRAKDRMRELSEQMRPLEEATRIAGDSAGRIAEIGRLLEGRKPQADIEYRSAGAYVLDYWRAGLGADDAIKRLQSYNRAAAHQTTADNPGLLPEQILGPVINFVDAARPMTSALGPRNLPGGSWSRPRITQHTDVAAQAGEKTELVSRKMTITKVPVAPTTYGGYVNVSRQDIDWTQPAIMDLVINDLAGVYAQETEQALCAAIDAATTAGPTIPTGPATPAAVNSAIWTAVGAVYAATKGAGRVIIACSPDTLGLLGPAFPAVNPTNAVSPGFAAADFAQGQVGSISGISVVVSAGFDTGTMIVLSTAAVEVYEDRIGSLQVVEPSVLGVQVAYAGYFASLIVEPLAIIEVTKTP